MCACAPFGSFVCCAVCQRCTGHWPLAITIERSGTVWTIDREGLVCSAVCSVIPRWMTCSVISDAARSDRRGYFKTRWVLIADRSVYMITREEQGGYTRTVIGQKWVLRWGLACRPRGMRARKFAKNGAHALPGPWACHPCARMVFHAVSASCVELPRACSACTRSCLKNARVNGIVSIAQRKT